MRIESNHLCFKRFSRTVKLIINIDPQPWSAVIATLKVSLASMAVSLIIELPAEFGIEFYDFYDKCQEFSQIPFYIYLQFLLD